MVPIDYQLNRIQSYGYITYNMNLEIMLWLCIEKWSDKFCNAICLMIGCEILDDFV